MGGYTDANGHYYSGGGGGEPPERDERDERDRQLDEELIDAGDDEEGDANYQGEGETDYTDWARRYDDLNGAPENDEDR